MVVTQPWFKHEDLQVSDIQSASYASAIRVKAVKKLITY
jgi:hypothetical protein